MAGAHLGAGLAVVTARHIPRDEGRLETRTHAARSRPRSDLAALRRTDRASVWRSAPLRRGTWLLALAPGAHDLAVTAGAIAFEHVSFDYGDGRPVPSRAGRGASH